MSESSETTDSSPADADRNHRIVESGISAPDVPEAARDVVQVEGPATSDGTDDAEITAWTFSANGDPKEVDIDELINIVDVDERFAWIDISEYTPDQLRTVARLLHLDRVAVHTALSEWQRPRLDLFADHFFVSATVARVQEREFHIGAGELDLFVGKNFLVSVHKLPLPFAAGIMARIQRNPELIRLDSAYMLYIILDELLAYFEGVVETIESATEQAEQHALGDADDDFLQRLLDLKRYTFAVNRLLEQHRQIFEAFLRPDFSWVSGEEVEIYFRDLESRLARLLGSLTGAKESVNGAFDIYVSHVSHVTNQQIKVLTMISAVIFPVTAIIGIFGTNFQHGNILYTQGGFIAMMVGIVLLTIVPLIIFRRVGWI